MNAVRDYFVCASAVRLATGEVLFAGLRPAQVCDPTTGTFLAMDGTSDLSNATLLANGMVLFAGRTLFYDGSPYLDSDGLIIESVTQMFNRETRRFVPFEPMKTQRGMHSVTLLAVGMSPPCRRLRPLLLLE